MSAPCLSHSPLPADWTDLPSDCKPGPEAEVVVGGSFFVFFNQIQLNHDYQQVGCSVRSKDSHVEKTLC